MARSDLAGQWQYLGTLTPLFEQWQRFPNPTSSANATIRLTFFDSLNFTQIGSFGYIRAALYMPELFVTPWRRIYPSQDRPILAFPIPPELLYVGQNVQRYFEVMKRNKYQRPNYDVVDTIWSVTIESLELIAVGGEQSAIIESINRIDLSTEQIRRLITEEDNE